MQRYTLSRLIQTIIVLVGVSLVLFLILYKMPGDPAKRMAGMKASPQVLENVRQKWGLDKPLPVQYISYAGNIAKGNLGTSYRYNRPVSSIFAETFPATAKLAVFAIFIEIVLGLAAGILSALKKRTFTDTFITISSTFLICVPVFWLGMLLQYIFGLKLGWLPVSGYEPTNLLYLILPGVTLAAISTGVLIRLIRASMLEVSGARYITMARAKGLSESRVLIKHQLKNALLPSVTFIGLELGALMTGAVATEIVFNYPGMGFAIYRAVMERDIPVVISGILIMVFVYVMVNFFIDIIYGYLNPRVRLGLNA